MTDTSCEFCIEFDWSENSLFYSLFAQDGVKSRVIRSSDSCIAIAGLGALTEGYILLLPKKHYLSLSQLPKEELVEFVNFKQELLSLMGKFYQGLICFEHGAVSNERRGGACVDHAHLHVCPCPADLSLQLDEHFQKRSVESISDLHLLDKPYLFYENQNGYKLVYNVPDKIESQYVRRLWANSLGLSDQWDWAIWIGKQNILNTLRKLSNIRQ